MNWTEADVLERSKRVGLSPPIEAPKRAPKPRMNKWEQEYAQQLELERRADHVLWFGFEAMKLRLAAATYYTPDFSVMTPNGLEFHEVKGFWRDDALVKFKVAAEQFPFVFVAMRKRKVSEGGGWEVIRYIKGEHANFQNCA